MSAHSPGPWRGDRLDGTVKYRVIDAAGHTVLLVDHKNGTHGFMCDPDTGCPEDFGRHDADQRLVLAAPDMLRALLVVRDAFREPKADIEAERNAINDAFKATCWAIDRAEGK